jgi:hypothetical protein
MACLNLDACLETPCALEICGTPGWVKHVAPPALAFSHYNGAPAWQINSSLRSRACDAQFIDAMFLTSPMKKAGALGSGLSNVSMDDGYSPPNFLCHHPLRWGAAVPAELSTSPFASPGPTTTRSMRGSLESASWRRRAGAAGAAACSPAMAVNDAFVSIAEGGAEGATSSAPLAAEGTSQTRRGRRFAVSACAPL